MISLQEFSYYREICRQKSIVGAANKLYVAQPLLTRTLKRMENELGVKLIHRTTRSFSITNAGNIVNEYAEKLLNEYGNMLLSIDKTEETLRGNVRLNGAGVLIDFYLANFIPELIEKYPSVKLTITHDTSMNVVQSIIDGMIDIGIIMLPFPKSSLIESKTLVEDELCVIVNKDHKYAGKETIDISELAHMPIAIFNRMTSVHRRFIEVCNKAGFSPNIQYECATTEIHFKIVERNSNVIGIMPRPYIDNLAKTVSIPLAQPIEWKIALIYKRQAYTSFTLRKIIDEVCSAICT